MQQTVLLITPPMVQLNTPYPATPVLTAALKEHGVHVVQADLSLAVAHHLFSPEGIASAATQAGKTRAPSPRVRSFLTQADTLAKRIPDVIRFLQGRAPELAWRIIRRDFLPEGGHFRELDPSGENLDEENLLAGFGSLGIQGRAKHLASLFLDDLADVFAETLDARFTLARYADHLAAAAPSFTPILTDLSSCRPTAIDTLIDTLTRGLIDRHQPDFVGVTAPFPGTVYGAFRIAQCVRRVSPGTRCVLGGGYVNSELRDLDDPRVFDFFDAICFDEGLTPWLGILGRIPLQRVMTRDGFHPAGKTPPRPYAVPVSDFSGLDLNAYLSLLETANPMHRLWSDGRWIKVQLAAGCYWHKCAFCDVTLDYIQRFSPADPVQAVDALVKMKRETGIAAFHFTDEALPPVLIDAMCEEILNRGEVFTWWGNIRFDKAFSRSRIAKMSAAGCIAVSGGLECANDRLLKRMNKGVTLTDARRICGHLSDCGIMVHVYLMHGFPTQTRGETIAALDFVRNLYLEDRIQSSYWHRFALTTHSPIARSPDAFGIRLQPEPDAVPRFARNEIPFTDPTAHALDAVGRALHLANDNYIRGAGLDLPAEAWFDPAFTDDISSNEP